MSRSIGPHHFANWTNAGGSLNINAITEFELKNLEESVKHVNATGKSETMLYVLDKAHPDQVKSYHQLLKKIHSGERAKALLSQLPEGKSIGLGVTTRGKLSSVADVYHTGVFKRLAGSLTRMKKAGKVGLAIATVAVFSAMAAGTSDGAATPEEEPIEIESFGSLRASIKDSADQRIVEAIIDNSRNAMSDAIKYEQSVASAVGVESGHFVQGSFNPIGFLPVVGDYLDSSNLGAPIVEFSSYLETVQAGIKSRVSTLKTRLEGIGTPLSATEEHEITDALYDAWGISQPWREY